MRAIQVTSFGGPEVLRPVEVATPRPATGELLVEVEAAEILFLDTQLRAGWGGDYFDVTPPFTPGVGVAGRVVDLGPGVEESWRGARVMASTSGVGEYRGGGYAERCAVPVRYAHRLPGAVDAADALAALHDGAMAVSRLDKATLPEGAVALVTAAGGGIGLWLVPMLARAGVSVVAAARGTDKLDLARSRGATIAVDYTASRWAAEVTRHVGGPIDIVFDGAGGALGKAAYELVRPGGQFFAYGAADGDFADVTGRADVDVVGIDEEITTEDIHRAAARALHHLAAGTVRAVIGARLPLDRAGEAHAAIAERSVVGKSVLLP